MITDRDRMLLLSNNRSNDELSVNFLIKQPTIQEWEGYSIDHPINGHKRFIIEFLRSVNISMIKKIKRKYNMVSIPDETDVARVIGMPLEDIAEFASSSIDWKRGIIEFLLKIDPDMMSDINETIDLIVKHRDPFYDGVMFDINAEKREIKIVNGIEVKKRKRGRKPKPKPETPPEPKKRGRKPKPKPETPPEPKKRGRKPKDKADA